MPQDNVESCPHCDGIGEVRKLDAVHPRTPAEVIREQPRNAIYGGCCNRFADHRSCSCLAQAHRDYPNWDTDMKDR